MANGTCSIDGCDRDAFCRSWCRLHYDRWRRTGDVYLQPRPTEAERFWAKVDKHGPNGCWLWTGYIKPEGYGTLHVGGRPVHAHRWAWKDRNGPILDGLTVDHLCRVRACVNPEHLEPVTNRENILRGTSPAADHARKTHCPQGHEYTPENTYRKTTGQRICKTCDNERCRTYRLTRSKAR